MKKRKTIEDSIDNLAVMVAKGFEGVDKKFEDIDKRFDSMETRLVNLEEGQKNIRRDILGLGDKFVSRFEFDKSLTRLHKLEGK